MPMSVLFTQLSYSASATLSQDIGLRLSFKFILTSKRMMVKSQSESPGRKSLKLLHDRCVP